MIQWKTDRQLPVRVRTYKERLYIAKLNKDMKRVNQEAKNTRMIKDTKNQKQPVIK